MNLNYIEDKKYEGLLKIKYHCLDNHIHLDDYFGVDDFVMEVNRSIALIKTELEEKGFKYAGYNLYFDDESYIRIQLYRWETKKDYVERMERNKNELNLKEKKKEYNRLYRLRKKAEALQKTVNFKRANCNM